MAKHLEHVEWLDSLDTVETDLGQFILFEFLLFSPALEVSARSKGWISRFGVHDSDDAEVLFDELTKNVRVLRSEKKRYASNVDDLEHLLRAESLLDGDFWRHESFVVYTVPNEAKTQVKNAITAAIDGNSQLKDRKRRLIQDKYLQVDALFRHIRNSIAHGAFQIKEVDGSKRVCIFQDASFSGDLSARLVIKEETLREWVASFRRYEAKGV